MEDVLVIIDVQLARWIGETSSTECDAYEVFAENAGEDRVAESALFGEDFVENVLSRWLVEGPLKVND